MKGKLLIVECSTLSYVTEVTLGGRGGGERAKGLCTFSITFFYLLVETLA